MRIYPQKIKNAYGQALTEHFHPCANNIGNVYETI